MSDIHALSGAYAVDAVDDLERAGFERHLAGCAACRAEVASLREAAAALPDDAQTPPPPELRAAVLGAISRVRPLPPLTVADTVPDNLPGTLPETDAETRPDSTDATADDRSDTGRHAAAARRRRWIPALVAAAVLAVVGTGLAVAQPWRDDSSTTLTAAEQVLGDPDAQRVTQELPVGGTATVVRSPTYHRTVVVTEDVPAPPDGKTYQMWLQDPSQTMVSAGLMPAGENTYLLKGNSDDALAAGLSLEPEGGSSQPTDVVALFDFSKSS